MGGDCDTLAFAESKMRLAILEHDLQAPASGVYLPCLEEIQSGVCGEKAVPFGALGSLCEEDPHGHTSVCDIERHIVAFEPAAVFLLALLLAKFHKLRGSEVLAVRLILCSSFLSDLYHSEPVAFTAFVAKEPHQFLASEPAVSKHIREPHTPGYGASDHFQGKINLGCVICLFPLVKKVARLLAHVSGCKFLRAHSVVAFLALLTHKLEFKEKFGDPIRYRHAEALETKYGLVCQMGMYPAYFLDTPAGLFMVSIIKYETDIATCVVASDLYLVPELNGYMPQGLSPVYVRIVLEPVEHIFPCLHEGGNSVFFVAAVDVPNPEERKKNEALEDIEQPLDVVGFAAHAYGVLLRHLHEPRILLMFCIAAVMSELLKNF